MPLTVAVQMDPIERINITGDSTFALLLEAQARGHHLFYYTPDRLSMRDGVVTAPVQSLRVQDVKGDHCTLGELQRRDIGEFDVVLLRQDPPFDLAYITTDPPARAHPPADTGRQRSGAGAQCPGEDLRHQFPDLMPSTLITRDRSEIRRSARSMATS